MTIHINVDMPGVAEGCGSQWQRAIFHVIRAGSGGSRLAKRGFSWRSASKGLGYNIKFRRKDAKAQRK